MENRKTRRKGSNYVSAIYLLGSYKNHRRETGGEGCKGGADTCVGKGRQGQRRDNAGSEELGFLVEEYLSDT